ncbi:DUF2062 domain-containing protein [Chromatium okenii]|uniref:DUF2062 domain-containing protein n=1 Tax=Chromatium okenii TaxID=61644 RepID=UPI001F5BA13F|nr:DUF2062 domain-containing protein [Chromatium okenii]
MSVLYWQPSENRKNERNFNVKKWLQQVIPTPKMIRENARLTDIFGKLLHDPNLWHLNRRSVAGAMAWFVRHVLTIPMQSIIAAGLAILFRVNLPISVAMVWVTNPVTSPPMFYVAYVIGCWILGMHAEGFNVHFWLDWHNWIGVIEPLLLGSLICGAVCGALGYFAVHGIWRWMLLHRIYKRKQRFQVSAASRVNTPSSNRQI